MTVPDKTFTKFITFVKTMPNMFEIIDLLKEKLSKKFCDVKKSQERENLDNIQPQLLGSNFNAWYPSYP